MKRQSNEAIVMINRRFSSFYFNMHKEVQCLEVTAMLYYATTFHPDLSFLLMKRKSMSLQQMFNDAQEVEENIPACEKLQIRLRTQC
jgi:hypothetical protein